MSDANGRGNPRLEIKETNGHKGVFAKEDIMMDSVIKLEGVVSSFPTRYSIELDRNKHLNLPADMSPSDDPDAFWIYLNHSCQPNGYINTAELTFHPLRKIEKGEECTFNYLATEYEMDTPFTCLCGAANCFGLIRGYKYLGEEQREEILVLL